MRCELLLCFNEKAADISGLFISLVSLPRRERTGLLLLHCPGVRGFLANIALR
jgi:hypothetical protein